MADASDKGVPCHNMTERECRLTQRINKLAQKHDELSRLISEIQHALMNNDWYFINHAYQIREESREGRRQRDSYLRALEKDVEDYMWELRQIGSLIDRTGGAVIIREIRMVEDDEDEEDDNPGEAPII